MIAKIVKGKGFKGEVNYVLDKEKDARLLNAEGVRCKNRESIIRSFVAQGGLNPRISKPVGHISLDFSAQDKGKLTNEKMLQIAKEYMDKMGIVNTQYIIVRHYDREHPHIHLVFNRIDNKGIAISDKNDRFRSEKICKELTAKYGLYFAKGKEKVKTHRLKEPDKTKYEIYNTLQSVVPKCQNWQELKSKLLKSGITVEFKLNGSTNKIQGVRFNKNGYVFNGSKIDRQFSFSKIDFQLKQNERSQNFSFQQGKGDYPENSVFHPKNLLEVLLPSTACSPPNQAGEDSLQQRKKKKRRGFRL